MAYIPVDEDSSQLFIGSDLSDVFEILDNDDDQIRLYGGGGNDLYLVRESIGNFEEFGSVFESAGGGIDTIRVENGYLDDYTYFLPGNVENAQFFSREGDDGNGLLIGNDLANNLSTNGDRADTIDGGAGNDTMAGGRGSDSYIVDSSLDVIVEAADGGDADRVWSSAPSYTLSANVEDLYLEGESNINGTGNALANDIGGNAGRNLLAGLAGNDTLSGANGNDMLQGGAGDDELEGDEGADTMDGGEGNDSLYGYDNTEGLIANDVFIGGGGDDLFLNVRDSEAVSGGAGNDIIEVEITGSVGPNVDGGAGDDTLFLSTSGALASYSLNATLENVILEGAGMELVGNALANHLTGDYDDDTLRGGAGNDVLDGRGGEDALFGGAGSDSYVVDEQHDLVVETSAAEGAADTVFTTLDAYALTDFVEHLVYGGGSEEGTFLGRGNNLGNSITGSADGYNELYGMAGNDTLDAQGGSGILAGGTGNDTYLITNEDNVRVVELAGEGSQDTVRSDMTHRLGMNVESLVLTGSGSISGYGNGSSNTITGNAGNNTLDGGRGVDSLAGGKGNDTYVVDATAVGLITVQDTVTELANEGTDTVLASASFTLVSANVENLTLSQGGGNINGTGNASGNVLTGNTGRNVLNGLGGNDQLFGNLGDDTLNGGDGNDTLGGGAGADSMDGGAGDDVIHVNQSGDAVTGGTGIDKVFSSVNFTLGADVEHLVLETETNARIGLGNTLANSIIGNENDNTLGGLGGNDTLDGGTGIDSMTGGDGNDTYRVDTTFDQVIETTIGGAAAGSADLVISTAEAYALAFNVENLTLEGEAYHGEGNDLVNVITGSAGNNALYGAIGNDTLRGGAGNDFLDGGIGIDLMEGGAGDDTYVVGVAGDVVTEGLNAGTDEVWTAISHTLAANVENLTLQGEAGAIDGTGNALNNSIYGNESSNTIRGLAGNDFLQGNGGSDRIEGGDGDDAIFGSTFLGDDDEAADTMDGGLGNDTFNLYQDDVVLADTGGANDVARLLDRDSFDAGAANVEEVNHFFSNSGEATITGGSANNLIRGLHTDTDYTLDGGGGNDTMEIDIAGSGQHTVTGGSGIDSLLLEADDTTTLQVEIAGVETVTVRGNGNLTIMETDGTGVTSYIVSDFFTSSEEALYIDAGNELTGEDITVTVRAGADFDLQTDEDVNILTIRSENSGPAVNAIYLDDSADAVRITGDEALAVLVNNGDAVGIESFNGAWISFGQAADGEGGSLGLTLDDVNTQLNLADWGNVSIEVAGDSEIVLNTVMSGESLFLSGSEDLSLIVENSGASIGASKYGGNLDLQVLDGDGLSITLGQGDDNLAGGSGNDFFDFGDRLDGNDHVLGGSGVDVLIAEVGHYTTADSPDSFDIAEVESVNFFGGEAGNVQINAAGIRGEGSTLYLSFGSGGDGGMWTIDGLQVDLSGFGSSMAVTAELIGNGQTAVGSGYGDSITGAEDSGENDISGGAGNDTLAGGGGNDEIYGGYGNDMVNGDRGHDTLSGGANADTLNGGLGDDALFGGDGADTLIGGAGFDDFYFDQPLGAGNVDRVGDFAQGEDLLMLDTAIFTQFAGQEGGPVQPVNFTMFDSSEAGVNTVGDGNDFLKYDTFTGNLYYDTDGGGATAAVMFARVLSDGTNPAALLGQDFNLFSTGP